MCCKDCKLPSEKSERGAALECLNAHVNHLSVKYLFCCKKYGIAFKTAVIAL